jgi:hypothetical protein
LFLKDFVCIEWQVAQSSPGVFAMRAVLFFAELCIEWHVRQFTVSVLACTPWANES